MTFDFDEAQAVAIVRQAAQAIQAQLDLVRSISRDDASLRWSRRHQSLGASERIAAEAGQQVAALLLQLATPLRSE